MAQKKSCLNLTYAVELFTRTDGGTAAHETLNVFRDETNHPSIWRLAYPTRQKQMIGISTALYKNRGSLWHNP